MSATKISVRHKVFLSIAFFSLLLGFINYVLFQPSISLLQFLNTRSSAVFFNQSMIQNFFSGHFSDIAWCGSLYLCIIVLTEKMNLNLADKLALLLLPFLTEILQKFNLLPGTFDWYDILSYSLILVITIRFFPHLILKNYEKA
jgi:hypothetical protein